MSNPSVAQYIYIFDQSGLPINEAIIDRATEDYPASLSGPELERATMEVEVMAWTDGYAHHQPHIRLVHVLQALHARIVELETRVAALEAAGQ